MGWVPACGCGGVRAWAGLEFRAGLLANNAGTGKRHAHKHLATSFGPVQETEFAAEVQPRQADDELQAGVGCREGIEPRPEAGSVVRHAHFEHVSRAIRTEFQAHGGLAMFDAVCDQLVSQQRQRRRLFAGQADILYPRLDRMPGRGLLMKRQQPLQQLLHRDRAGLAGTLRIPG